MSKCTWTYLMKQKSKNVSILAKFFNLIHNQYSRIIKTIRSNNGAEFIFREYQALFSHHGICHQKSVPYTAQQNEVVERKHQHLLDTVRALRLHANLLKEF